MAEQRLESETGTFVISVEKNPLHINEILVVLQFKGGVISLRCNTWLPCSHHINASAKNIGCAMILNTVVSSLSIEVFF